MAKEKIQNNPDPKPGRKRTAVNQDNNQDGNQARTTGNGSACKPGRKAKQPVLTDSTTGKPSGSIPAADNTTDIPVKRKGRPKGATDKQERKKRTDCSVAMDPNENSNMIKYAMTLMNLPRIDYNNIEQLKQRITDYFEISSAFGYKPAVASLASALSVDRATLFNWLNGKTETIKSKQCFDTLKAAYDSINMLYEVYMNTGKINPVAGIFLMKNNMGYKDTTDYIVSAGQDNQVALPDITNRAGLLSE